MPASESDFKEFIKKFRECWLPRCHVLKRPKNETCIHTLGITEKHRKNEIMSLGYRHYVKGPEPDDNKSPGEIWFFNKKVKGTEIYIKLKIWEYKKRNYAKCISFHPKEY